MTDSSQARPLRIRTATDSDLPAIREIHARAFGQDTEARLTRAILADPTAQPTLSLLAEEDGRPQGHILFSKVRLTEPDSGRPATILAPLAVVPEAQGKGGGGLLIEAGLQRLRDDGIDLVFVLGDPGYYQRFGFQSADCVGLDAPYPLPEERIEAWRVRALRDDVIGRVHGKVACCEALMEPELWRE